MAANPDVKKAQGYLRSLGYSDVDVDGKNKNLAVDGIEGDITKAAMKKFRAENDLPENATLAETTAKMETVLQKDPQKLATQVQETMAQGNNASPDNISSMQGIMNLIAKVFEALTGKELKIDGINGPKTQERFSELNTLSNGALTQGAPAQAAPAKDEAAFQRLIDQNTGPEPVAAAPAPEAGALRQEFRAAAAQPAPAEAAPMIVMENPAVAAPPPMADVELGVSGGMSPAFNASAAQTAPPQHYAQQAEMAPSRPHQEYMQPMSRNETQGIMNNGRATRDAVRTRETVDTSDSRVFRDTARNVSSGMNSVLGVARQLQRFGR